MLAAALGALVATSAGAPAFRGTWELDAAWLVSAALMDRASMVADAHGGTPDCPCDPDSVPWYDRTAIGRHDDAAGERSDIGRDLLVFGAPLAASLADPGAPLTRAHAGVIVIEAILVTRGATSLLKSSFHRPRPYAYTDDEPSFDESSGAYHSMPSGHTSSAFAAATSLAVLLRHRRPGSRAGLCLTALAYVVAGSVAWHRVEAGVHFPSDVVAGAALGTGAGWAVTRSRTGGAISLAPSRDGLALFVRF